MRVLAAVAALLLVPTSALAAPGPEFEVPAAPRVQAVKCQGDLRTSPQLPVLLVHGTGVTAEENWSIGYRTALLSQGHSVCTVDLPDYGYGDVQVTVQYVASAIRQVQQAAGRKISILGHSQGAFEPLFALRVWPDLAKGVDDFVGLAGVYDAGSVAIASRCAAASGCVPSFHQMAAGSSFLQQLSRRRLPAGPSYSAIGTNADETVTPQPAANRMQGVRSAQIQQVCPGRAMPLGADHVLMAGDAVAFALVVDALHHAGPVDISRVDPALCNKLFFDQVDVVAFALEFPGIVARQGGTTTAEPAVRCVLKPRCRSLVERGRMLAKVRVKVKPLRTYVVVVAQAEGRVQYRLGKQKRTRWVQPGRTRMWLPTGPSVVRVRTMPRYYEVWTREFTRKLS